MRVSVCLLLGLAACVEPPSIDLDETTQHVDTNNGKSLNGKSLNGTSLSGANIAGQTLASVARTGTSATGGSISANLSGTAQPLTGTTFVGATFNGTTSGGVAIKVRIDSAAQGTGANADLWFYGASYQTTTGWIPLCGLDGASQPIRAVSVTGLWAP